MVEVVAEVDKKGGVPILLRGFVGQACVPEVQKITEALRRSGVELDVQVSQPTEEFYLESEAERVRTG